MIEQIEIRDLKGKKGTMSCTKIETKLIAYVDGLASGEERREVEAHLKSCALCARRVEEFRSVSSLLDELPLVEPSEAFDVRVRARVAAEPQPRGWLDWLAPSPRVAFAAALLLALTVWMSSMPPDPDKRHQELLESSRVADSDFRMIKDLPVLQDYDVLSNFELLTDLSQKQQPEAGPAQDNM